MTKRHLTIATRESPLALKQTEIIKNALLSFHPHLRVDILGITTQADRMLETKLTEIGGKGLFVKELEEALLDGRADIAVHSMKDVPMELPPGLILPVITKREQPRDVFVSNQYQSLMQLPASAVVGTASLRRETQLHALRSDLIWKELRGNIQTRLRKLDNGDYDAIILAAAGLLRMRLSNRIKEYFTTEQVLPAAGQGALGIECREGDSIAALIAPLNDAETFTCVSAERALCRRLGGGCKIPLAAYAHFHQQNLVVQGLLTNARGDRTIKARITGNKSEAETLGVRAAESLIEQGAYTILKEFV